MRAVTALQINIYDIYERRLTTPRGVASRTTNEKTNLVSGSAGFSDSFQIERNVIVVTVFLLLINQTEFCLVHNQN